MESKVYNSKGRRIGLVRLRGGFSDVSGISPSDKTIQLEEFSDDTRTRISNKLYELLERAFNYSERSYLEQDSFCRDLLNDVFCQRNSLSYRGSYLWMQEFRKINEAVEQTAFNEVLDIVEYICRWIDSNRYCAYAKRRGESFFAEFNRLFEQEYVGYRFVNGRIVAISDETEIVTIEEACHNPIDGCRVQLQKALDFLADRENRDYKNSIKESISAVESICQVIVGDDNTTLGKALGKLEERGLVIHPSLKQAFIKLYGFSSDQGGIRHAEGMYESKVTFEEAKFMLVSCSAFINYLKTEMGKLGY